MPPGPPPVRTRNHTIPDTRHSRPGTAGAVTRSDPCPRRAAGRIMGYVNTSFRWWTGLSQRRRILFGALALVVAAAAVVTGALVSGGAPEAIPGRPGAVLLVPGYGGSATALYGLAARIRAS